jgi:GDPmannose 4,6-dehydratase
MEFKHRMVDRITDTSEKKIAFITGVGGQDGSWLAEFLLSKNYIVYGMIRRSSLLNTERIEHIRHKLRLMYGDITDMSCLCSILQNIKSNHPNLTRLEIFHLAAQSHVKVSFEIPIHSTESTALGTLKLLEAIRVCDLLKIVRFYQASTSELFGGIQEAAQDETTYFHPKSPYAIAKLFGFWSVVNYREAYNLHASNCIVFNHSSCRRGLTFVDRKVTVGLGKILRARQTKAEIPCLVLGNMDAKRDWLDAREVVELMWNILQQDIADDYVIASGKQYSIREFVQICFKKRGITLFWEGSGLDEVGRDQANDEILVCVSAQYFRPSDVESLLGNATKAQKKLGWTQRISFDQMIDDMLAVDAPISK